LVGDVIPLGFMGVVVPNFEDAVVIEGFDVMMGKRLVGLRGVDMLLDRRCIKQEQVNKQRV
jgi:hypothetical protein